MATLTGNENATQIEALRSLRAQGAVQEPLVLTRRALARMIERYGTGEITTAELVRLANSVEAVDGVDYEAGAEAEIAQVLFELAAPEINGEVSYERSQKLLAQLTPERP